MSGFDDDGWCLVGVEGLLPAFGAEAPVVTGLEALEAEFGTGRGKVVAGGLAELQEVLSHHSANSVHAMVVWPESAMTVAHESRQGIHAAGDQGGAEDVGLLAHFWGASGRWGS